MSRLASECSFLGGFHADLNFVLQVACVLWSLSIIYRCFQRSNEISIHRVRHAPRDTPTHQPISAMEGSFGLNQYERWLINKSIVESIKRKYGAKAPYLQLEIFCMLWIVEDLQEGIKNSIMSGPSVSN